MLRSFYLLLVLVVSGCASVRYDIPADPTTVADSAQAGRLANLTQELVALDTSINRSEAEQVASTSIYYSMQLANEYELTSPPLFHNTLVNMGIKERGLCIHWTADLRKKLKSMRLKSFDVHWVVANKRASFRIEHSSVVVSARGKPYTKGLVLDPWRYSGKLYWAKVADDEYEWEHWR